MKLAMVQDSRLPDPRTFIKSAPLPFPSHKGVKIQARSFNVYNAAFPSRDTIRSENYSRRRDQMNSMGFKTPLNLPYKVIGDPLHLDHKSIILYGLGQVNDSVSLSHDYSNISNNGFSGRDKNISPNQNEYNSIDKTPQLPRSFTYRSLNRSKKLISLRNEVQKTQILMKRVKLGHSLFEALKAEDELALRKKEEKEQSSLGMVIRPIEDEFFQDYSDEEANEETNRIFETASRASTSIFYKNNTLNSETIKNSLYNTQNSRQIGTSDENRHDLFLKNDDMLSINNKPLQTQHHNNFSTNFRLLNIASRPVTVPIYLTKHNVKRNSETKRPKTSGSRKYRDISRPYTPMYSSLLTKDEAQMDRNSLIRQLCVLLWILDSISEPPNTVGPLRTCFFIKDLGGKKIPLKESNDTEKIEKKWKMFVRKNMEKNQYGISKERKPRKITKTLILSSETQNIEEQDNDNLNDEDIEINNNLNTNNKITNNAVLKDVPIKRITQYSPSSLFNDSSLAEDDFIVNNAKIQLVKKSNQESMNDINTNLPNTQSDAILSNLNTLNINNNNNNLNLNNNNNYTSVQNLELSNFTNNSDLIRDQSFLNQLVESNNNQAYNSIFGIAKESSSIHNPSEIDIKVKLNENKSRIPKSNKSKTNKNNYDIAPCLTDHEMELLKIGDIDEMDRILNKPGIRADRRNSSSLKASRKPIHGERSDRVREYEKRLPSVKKSLKLQELKDQFENLIDEKAIEVDKRLESLLKKRVSSCFVKYSSLTLKERGLHTMLSKMNNSYLKHEKSLEQKDTPEPKYYQWYMDLEYVIEANYNKDDALLGQLLDRLSSYGKLSAKKQNEATFFRVLDTIRAWELISPDVMSAIEFCRERILEISIHDFENWFRAKHPDCFITRNNENSESKN